MRDSGKVKKSAVVTYILINAYWFILLWIGYNAVLLKTIGKHTLKESRIILIVMIIAGSVLGLAIDKINKSNKVSVFLNLMIGFTTYTIICYWQVKAGMITISLILIALVTAAYVVIDYNRSFRKQSISLRRWLVRTLIGGKNLLCCGCMCLLVILYFTLLAGHSIVEPTVNVAGPDDQAEWTIADNIDTLTVLRNGEWKNMSIDEKTDVLQILANIYRYIEHVPHELNVGVSNLGDSVRGCYDDKQHKITLSLDLMQNGSAQDVTEVLLHEVEHSRQHAMVLAYEEASEELRELDMFCEAAIYKREFEDYKGEFSDFCEYYNQNCEEDARDYAERATSWLFCRIDDYLMYGE